MNCNDNIEIVFGLSLRSGFYNIGFLFNEFCGLLSANSHNNGPLHFEWF